MMSAIPSVFDPGLSSVPNNTTPYTPPDLPTLLISRRNGVQQEMKIISTTTKHPSFFASFAMTPGRCYHFDPLDEALQHIPA